MSIYKKLGWFFKQERISYIIGISLLVLVAILGALTPWMLGKVIDQFATGTITGTSLTIWLSLMLGAAILQYVFRYFWRMLIFGTSIKLEKQLRESLYQYFLKMDAKFFQENRTGDLMAHATNDLNAIRMVAGPGILTLADSLTTGGLTLLSMMLVVDWRMTLLVILPLPFLTLVSRILGRKIHGYFKKAQAAFSQLNDKTQESVSGMKVIKTFGEEPYDIADFQSITHKVVEANRRVIRVDSLFNPMINLILGLTFGLTILIGGHFVSQDIITIGQLVSFTSYIGMMTWPMLAVGRLFNVLERGNASYDRVQALMSQKSTITEKTNPLDRPIIGKIDFALESFTYPGQNHPALQDIHFQLEPGKTIGIVGKTGSGKSSIFRVLLREFDYQAGQVSIDGEKIEAYSLSRLSKSIAYVPQDSFLFSTTILENIRFSNPSLSLETAQEYAQKAAIHQDILDLPQGYQTLVGERGVSLSGGQKQRISIARAMITQAPILILDDSLSAVDAATEEAILGQVREAKDQQQTVLIAAHRLSSVMHADEILVLDQGRIIERGSHSQLLALNGWYKDMFDRQQLELKLEGEDVENA